MRIARKNQQHLYYCLLEGVTDGYKLDSDGNKIIDKVASDGTVLYLKTGKKELIYSEPQGFMGSLSFSSGEVEVAEYGVDISSYDAILIMPKGAIPITETSLLWFETEPKYKDADKTIIDNSSADFKVLQVKPSLDYTKYILGKLTK